MVVYGCVCRREFENNNNNNARDIKTHEIFEFTRHQNLWKDRWIERRSTYMLCKFGESLNISYGNGGSIGLNMDIMCMRVLYVRFFLMVNEKKPIEQTKTKSFYVCFNGNRL